MKDILKQIEKREKIKKMYFLEKELTEKLKKVAEEKGMHESELLNEILRKILE